MKRPLAFALSGGGARGALQVGALRALLEANLQPDILVGSSIGAVNATYLAVFGVTLANLDRLVSAWQDAVNADLLPSNYLWLTLRTLFNRPGWQPYHRMREFFISHGLTPDICFGDIQGVQLIIVATDLNSGRAIRYGTDPRQKVLDSLLASTALPPWIRPLEKDNLWLIDGGVISNLPIEPALQQGAREIIALDLSEPRDIPVETHGFGPFLSKLQNTIEERQKELEMALARARDIPVHRIELRGEEPVAIWDFKHADALLARGYQLARAEIATWQIQPRPRWRDWLQRLKERILRMSTMS